MTDRSLGYYKWFWQDFRANRKVQRMSYIERGLYRELLDECWAEGSIPDCIEELADICDCPIEVMADAWQALSKCFTKSSKTWHNEKLETMRTERDQIRIKKVEAGRLGGMSKSLKINSNLPDAKHMLSTCHIEEKRREEKSQEENIKPKATKVAAPIGVSIELWSDYLTLRRSKKLPVTATALKGIEREASKAGKSIADVIRICCERGWGGFKADWLKDTKQNLTGQQSAWLTITGQTLNDQDDYHGRTIETDPLPPALLG